MCGIFGIIDKNGLRDSDRFLLDRLAASLFHRGPDGGGVYVDKQAAIGMRRLSIIDVAHGNQPLWNESRNIGLVANGEIYNFVELRAHLEKNGHVFSTNSDCETILHLYEEYGTNCVSYLRGMFAFALIDIDRCKVLIVRDRLGEKPLYLAETAGRLVFASELKALVASGVVPFRMCDKAIHDYFMWGFVPEPGSAVLGTRKLAAGWLIEIDLDSGDRIERQWWSAMDAPPLEGDPEHLVRDVLEEIGQLVTRSDVPVGVALSGGVDSNLMASMASRHAKGLVHAFTVGYTGRDRHDESDAARECADRLGIEHHCIYLDPADISKSFSNMCLRRDEPIADISGSGYMALMELSRSNGVPVLLMGQGGDELFWGYPWTIRVIQENLRKSRYLKGQAGVWNYVHPLKPPRSYPGLINWMLGGFGLSEGIQALRRDQNESADRMVFWDQRSSWLTMARGEQSMASIDFINRTRNIDSGRFFTGPGLLDRPDISITDLLLKTYLLGNGINQCDRLAMASSVECRLPLVDYRLVEVAIGLRKHNEDWKLPKKHWLAHAAKDMVPNEVFLRRKQGFTPPWRTWYKSIFKKYGNDLNQGELFKAGILSDFGNPPSPIDPLGRPREFLISALMLEEWARGMKSLETNGC